MAKLYTGTRPYVVVEKGDTLSGIASTYKSYSGGASYQKLAEINGIPNPNRIVIGQKIYLTKATSSGGSSSSPTTTTTTSNSNQAVVTNFGLQANTERTMYATWEWSKHSQTEHYRVRWLYGTGDGISFVGSDTTTTERQATWDFPEKATTGVSFFVMPISKKKKDSKGNETPYWTAKWSEEKKYYPNKQLPPATPPTPSVEIVDNRLTATVQGLANDCKQIEFQIIQNGTKTYTTGLVNITTDFTASYSCDVEPGATYSVRCRAIRDGIKSTEWSEYSTNNDSGPCAVTEITSIKAFSSDSIRIEWTEVSNSDKTGITYRVEYTTKKEYFDISEKNVQSETIDAKVAHHAIITGIGSGEEYFFRVRSEKGEHKSTWTDIKSITIGKAPAAPTTWSSSTKVMQDEKLYFYWVHNSRDGSSQVKADIELYFNGEKEPYYIEWYNTLDEDKKDDVSKQELLISSYSEGTFIEWRVRTYGITGEAGEWSVLRSVTVYDKTTATCYLSDGSGISVTNSILRSFPLVIRTKVKESNTQKPIGYNIQIVSNDSYETVDHIGNRKLVSEGETVYSKQFDVDDLYTKNAVRLSAGFIDLENNITYTVYVTVAMDSGIVVYADEHADGTHGTTFTVRWIENRYEPNAEITIDKNTYSATIRAYCETNNFVYNKVSVSSNTFTKTLTTFSSATVEDMDSVYTNDTGEKVSIYKKSDGSYGYYCADYTDDYGFRDFPIYYSVTKSDGYIKTNVVIDPVDLKPVRTTTGEEVLLGIFNSSESFYCITNNSVLVPGVNLSVYRLDYDGGFTEIARGLNNTRKTYVTDPHPALDYARYRIVAEEESTGGISYYDVPGYPVNGDSIIIQWDDEWRDFYTDNEDVTAEQAWTGSMLKLPYNIDVSDKNSTDVEFVEYIGRSHPVSYYGTHLGTSATWNVSVPKSDKETIYALRRLMTWMGNVYVREPSGAGYWANVSVSFSQKHRDLVVPVTIDITRVEGGV